MKILKKIKKKKKIFLKLNKLKLKNTYKIDRIFFF